MTLRNRRDSSKEPRKSINEKETEKDNLIQKKPCNQEKFPMFWYKIVLSISFLTRFLLLNHPDQVVFDEVHFGKFASYYLRREYYFDVHPPLGKLLIALAGYLVRYDGHFLFDKIGLSYIENNVPYIGMRALLAALGSCIAPITFRLLWEMNIGLHGILLACLFIVFDTALVVQSRLILLDAILLFGIIFSTYSWTKFYKLRNKPFEKDWWKWLTLTGLGLGLTLGTKMVGTFIIFVVGIATILDLWRLLDYRRGLSDMTVLKHFLARAVCLIVLPLGIYLASFYIHFAILTKSGPGDHHMSTKFQTQLIGSRLAGDSFRKNFNFIISAVYYGTNVTIRSHVENVFLHSHKERYPLRHNDKKVSSQGQQVTGYSHEDNNNHWRFHKIDAKLMESDKVIIKNGDIVRLEHVATKSFLLTHDVASPLTMTNMEVTTYPFNETLRYNETLWKVEINEEKSDLYSLHETFRLVHLKTKVSLMNYGKNLPKWGFEQREINGLKDNNAEATYWLIQSIHSDLKFEKDEIRSSNIVKLGFWSKFLELQSTMLSVNSNLKDDHPFGSRPEHWPLMRRGVSFWEDKEKSQKIYMIGNPIVWIMGFISFALLLILITIELILARRGLANEDKCKIIHGIL
ncbi:Glycosyl transferase, family 39 domain-containing protein [Rozella allomycis CSF55]|uniref:Dolichyl-phosphate-mannose--protein mannosyltransferase n=1 Tax=Rozella allomycis (strain CSF55) TaxID=988480 RepID=A0A075AZM3_ROZAC|nr:Glycosyl transferase, family 39 domain-containing protein [Rozella allomycis CSF55]|eukprot:EPZ34034.1 Glycosyl transferase, family 39 domain-containing protein [Rozella allomycis CSF55]